ncbi:MAG: hypothetical protein V1799_03785 [bacterium]
MNLKESIIIIESHEFSARLRVASDFLTFIKGAQTEECVQYLSLQLKDNRIQRYIFSRFLNLSQQSIDLRYEHPFDTPLTIYLWLMNDNNQEYVKIMAETILNTPNCWWSKKLSAHFLLNRQIDNNVISFHQVIFQGTEFYSKNFEVGESIIISLPNYSLPFTKIFEVFSRGTSEKHQPFLCAQLNASEDNQIVLCSANVLN